MNKEKQTLFLKSREVFYFGQAIRLHGEIDISDRPVFVERGEEHGNEAPCARMDFFIGRHTRALGAPILTRDLARYRTYFLDVRLFGPK
jgi:hypothetical protein